MICVKTSQKLNIKKKSCTHCCCCCCLHVDDGKVRLFFNLHILTVQERKGNENFIQLKKGKSVENYQQLTQGHRRKLRFLLLIS